MSLKAFSCKALTSVCIHYVMNMAVFQQLALINLLFAFLNIPFQVDCLTLEACQDRFCVLCYVSARTAADCFGTLITKEIMLRVNAVAKFVHLAEHRACRSYCRIWRRYPPPNRPFY